jgi:soluble lytic murein transglycosylase-like protein
MAALKLIAIAAALVLATPANAQMVERWQPYVVEASARFGIPQAWIIRVMTIESRGRTILDGRPIRSPKGAIGLMQLMPSTWRDMRAAYALGDDPDDPHDNIIAGTAYLRLMYGRFGYPGLFAAYNAGPGRYGAYLAGTPLPGETRDYVQRVTSDGTPNPGDRAEIAPPRTRLPVSIFAIPPTRSAGVVIPSKAPRTESTALLARLSASPR